MFMNRKSAEEKAAEIVREKMAHQPGPGRDRAQRELTDRLEKQLDAWTRENVGLD
jgi:hypothetical protein